MVLKDIPLHHKTICPSRFALVSLNKHFGKDSSFQVGCNYSEIFSSRGGSAILMNMSFLTLSS